MLELTAIPSQPSTEMQASKPENLGWGQSYRYDIGLPWQGAQPAFVYIDITSREPDWTKCVPDKGHGAMVCTVPPQIDVSTKERRFELLHTLEEFVMRRIGPSDQETILDFLFQPSIDEGGQTIPANDIGIGWFKVIEPHQQAALGTLQATLLNPKDSNLLQLTR